jgi:hypothetical protein
MKMVTLSNGKRVGNFSSPHPFTFEDNTVLPAVSKEEAEQLSITFIEEDMGNGDIKLTFDLPDRIDKEMYFWYKLWKEGSIDVVFCPLPMISCLHSIGYDVKNSPFRSIRITNRISKLASITKQCL